LACVAIAVGFMAFEGLSLQASAHGLLTFAYFQKERARSFAQQIQFMQLSVEQLRADEKSMTHTVP